MKRNGRACPPDCVTDAAAAERGSVTVEAALGLCSLLVVFGLVIAGVAVVAGQLRCTDAAGAAARLLARGQWHRAEELVGDVAPDDARMVVHSDSGPDTVMVTVVSSPFGGLLPGVEARGEAYAVLEPGADPPPGSVTADDA